MNEYPDSLSDEGPLTAGEDHALSLRFRLWRGPDGKRLAYSVYDAAGAPDYPDAVALVVRHMAGRRVAIWSGPAGAAARAAAEAAGAPEIHLRILPRVESGPLVPELSVGL